MEEALLRAERPAAMMAVVEQKLNQDYGDEQERPEQDGRIIGEERREDQGNDARGERDERGA